MSATLSAREEALIRLTCAFAQRPLVCQGDRVLTEVDGQVAAKRAILALEAIEKYSGITLGFDNKEARDCLKRAIGESE